MKAAEGKSRPVHSQPFEGLESPFLDEELFDEESEAEWEPRLEILEAESPFLSALEQSWALAGAAEMESAEAFEDKFAFEEPGIIKGENRVRVRDTTGVPWRWICKIVIHDSRRHLVGQGTGVLISDRHVLTAAHVVYDAYKNMHQYTITVIPALNDLNKPFDSYSITAKPKIRNEFSPTAADSLDWDYALLTLRTAIGKRSFPALRGSPLCYWGSPRCGANTVFARPDPRTHNGKAVYTAGYPGGKGGKQLWYAAGILHSVHERRRTMMITADTTKGQSGSPVWVIEYDRYCLVGVAAGTHEDAASNTVVRVTSELIRQLRVWIAEDGEPSEFVLLVTGETPSMIETEEAFEPPVPLLPQLEEEFLPYSMAEEYEPPAAEGSPEPVQEEEASAWENVLEQDASSQELERGIDEETPDPDREFAEVWTGESTEGAENPAGIGETGSVTPLAHMAFDHILLESLDSATSAMVPGVVPATPAALTTPFFDASVAGTIPDPTLQQALTSLISSKPAYKNAGKNIAVSLVDLSGANKRSPKYAGFNDLTNFYGASVNKITGLLGVYQLLAEANELLKAKPTIGDAVGLESELKILWTQAGIAAQHHPQVTMILAVQPGSPAIATIRPELVARLRRISKGNQNGSTPIILLKFPYIGSTMLAHGLYSPANGGGLWTRSAYGAIMYLGQSLSLSDWSTKENPHPRTAPHNINAVSVAQFYTLAAQYRMIDEATSKAVLGHLQTGGCTTVIDATALYASGQVSTKCGSYNGWAHNTLHFKETATLREFVVVILTKNSTFGIMKNLFKDLVALVP